MKKGALLNVVPHSAVKTRMVKSLKDSHAVEILSRLLTTDYESFDPSYVRQLISEGYNNPDNYQLGCDVFGLDEDGFLTAAMLALCSILEGGIMVKSEVCWIELTENVDTGFCILESGTVLFAIHEINMIGKEWFMVDNQQIPNATRRQLTVLTPDQVEVQEVLVNEMESNILDGDEDLLGELS